MESLSPTPNASPADHSCPTAAQLRRRFPLSAPGVVLLLCLFALLLLPLASRLSRWRGDECFYADGALTMHLEGDIVTPLDVNGEPRFNKPPLTYWAILLSYRTFGVSAMSARLPSLIAGVCIIWLTWLIGKTLFDSEEIGAVAACLTASNFIAFQLSLRATPDILLCAGTSVSLYGFIRVIFGNHRGFNSLAPAYFGAALAVMAKGFAGLLPVLFVFGWCGLRKASGCRVRDLVCLRAMLPAAALAVAWFAVVYAKHGPASLAGFFQDQLSSRMHKHWFLPFSHAAAYAFSLVGHFLPWSLFAAVVLWRNNAWARRFIAAYRDRIFFIGAWFALLVFVFSFGNILRMRYLFPACVLLCGAYAALLVSALHAPETAPRARLAVRILLAFQAVAGIGIAGIGSWLGGPAGTALVLVLALACWLWRCFRTQRSSLSLSGAAVAMLFLYAMTDLVVRPALRPSPAPELARKLLDHGITGRAVAAWGSPRDLVSQVRLITGGRISPVCLPADATPDDLSRYRAVFFVADRKTQDWRLPGYSVELAGAKPGRASSAAFWNSLIRKGRERTLLEIMDPCYVAIATNAGTGCAR